MNLCFFWLDDIAHENGLTYEGKVVRLTSIPSSLSTQKSLDDNLVVKQAYISTGFQNKFRSFLSSKYLLPIVALCNFKASTRKCLFCKTKTIFYCRNNYRMWCESSTVDF